MATLPRSALAVTGTTLETEIRKLLVSLNYTRNSVAAAISWVESRGHIDACPVVDREDYEAVNALVERHSGHVEGDPRSWPAWCDSYRWAPTEPKPFEPSEADREWAATEFAALDALTNGLVPADLPPIRGGAPKAGSPGSPQHARQAAVAARVEALVGVRSRTTPHTDRDVRRVGSVG